MDITVIICTHNRCQNLPKALESIAASTLHESVTWEVLVVDNNSSDQTRQVVGDFCRQHTGRFRYLFEAQPGKSHALNAGIRDARGEILAFTDDDVTVEPTWLQNLTADLRNGGWAGVGGRVLPERTFSPPSWLSIKSPYVLVGPLGLFDLGLEAGQLKESPFGNNMAFRRNVFEKYGGFRTDLGPRPGSEIRDEDTEFGARLLDAREFLRYEPSAVVYHEVPDNRVQKKYFLNWWFDKGRAEIRQFGIPSGSLCCFGVPLYLFRRLVVRTVQWMLTIGPAKRFSCKIIVWGKVGEILECYRRSGNPGKQGRPCNAQS